MAVAVAAAIAAASQFPKGKAFLQQVLRYVPSGMTHEGIRHACDFPPEALEEAANTLGTGRQVTSQDTVPFCLWCAAHHLENYEAALWTTVTPQGDRDTNCAIVGGIVSLSARRVPAEWLARREPLPEDVRFEDYY